MPIQGRQQNQHFPPIDKLSYDNYLVAVNEIYTVEYKFTLKDGANCGLKGSGSNWTCLKIN